MQSKKINQLAPKQFSSERGITRFEIFFVMAVIALLMVVGLQRFFQLAEETQQFSFEMLTHKFNTAIQQLHNRWILDHQKKYFTNTIVVDGVYIQFSDNGWPVSATQNVFPSSELSTVGCHQLWMTLFQNPDPISYNGGDSYGSRAYDLSITTGHQCRFQLVTAKPNEYFFDYSPISGQVIIQTPVNNKNHKNNK